MTVVLNSVQDVITWRKQNQSNTIGFVPTMGALHNGHESLLARSKSENDLSILSIYINPTQFNNVDDFTKYPKTWDHDLKIARNHNIDVIFKPNYDELYPDNYKFKVIESDFSHILCGADRPGHFDGVLTVVLKFLNIIRPTNAYFGEKDFQQLTLIRNMVKSFFLPTHVVECPIIRNANGLALSSRNSRLNADELQVAEKLNSVLTLSKSATEAKIKMNELGVTVNYIVDIDNRRLASINVGPIRLIDNVKI